MNECVGEKRKTARPQIVNDPMAWSRHTTKMMEKKERNSDDFYVKVSPFIHKPSQTKSLTSIMTRVRREEATKGRAGTRWGGQRSRENMIEPNRRNPRMRSCLQRSLGGTRRKKKEE